MIPPFVMERPPSAELKADQVDPFDYPRISPVVEAMIQGGRPADPELERFARAIRTSEHKRWQYGIGLKVSEKAFGTGRMIPVTKV